MESHADLSEAVRKSIVRIRTQTNRGAQAIAEVQQCTRGSTEGSSSIDVRAATLEALSLRAFALKRAGISVQTEGHDGPLMVSGNRARLQHAMVNLLLNVEQARNGR